MTRPDAAIDDLVALARRGDLSEHDERRLREQLATDDASNELYEAGRAFDLEDAVRVDDGARIEAIVEATALEVERIGEGQRFTTRLLQERGVQSAPQQRLPGQSITPH